MTQLQSMRWKLEVFAETSGIGTLIKSARHTDCHPQCFQEKGAKPQEAEPKERKKPATGGERNSTGDLILALLQNGPEVTLSGFAITGAIYISFVLEPLWMGFSSLLYRESK